jgi:twinkle protein
VKEFSDYGIIVTGTGQVATTCPECSHTRKKNKVKCLSVNTDEGVWSCKHCGWSGALNKYEARRKVYKKPKPIESCDPLAGYKLPQKPTEWFKERGITEITLTINKIGYGKVYMPQVEAEVNAIKFPYCRNGELLNIKYRDGQKNFRLEKDCERIFYGLDRYNPGTTIICEGEIDKLSFDEAGIPNALSVPDGAPAVDTKNYQNKFDYLESAADLLENVKEIILAVDNDEPGKKLEEELARRLGRERCKRVIWPEGCKDANDVLVKHGKEVLSQCVNNAEPYPIKGIFEARDIFSQIDRLYEHGEIRGEGTGWYDLDKHYTVRPGELTLVVGLPSHGKSSFLDALMVNLTLRGWCFGVYSPENQPLERHASKLIELYCNKPFSDGLHTRLTKEELGAAKQYLQEYFTFILPNMDDPNTLNTILDLSKAVVLRKGVKGLVIDPWNELDHSRPEGLTETEYISGCLSKLRRFARLYGLHIWLIAHPTKLKKQENGLYPVPTPYDAAGSAHFWNKADNAISVWRDLNDEKNIVQIHIQKIRFKEVGMPGMIELVYDRTTNKFISYLQQA